MSFGYVYVGLRGTEELSRQYNINVYTPTMMIFKEHVDKPADVIQVSLRGLRLCLSVWVLSKKYSNCFSGLFLTSEVGQWSISNQLWVGWEQKFKLQKDVLNECQGARELCRFQQGS